MIRLALLVFAVLVPRPSDACDRARMPSGVIVAAADLVMLGDVLEVSGAREIRVKPVRVLKGEAKGPVTIGGVHTERRHRFEPCQAIVVEKGGRYLFAAAGGKGSFRIVDPDDGVEVPSEIERAELDVALKGPHSPPREQEKTGLMYTLVAPRAKYRANDDIDLFILLDNTGKKPVQLSSKTWPPEKHTYCTLKFTPEVAAEPSPISKEDIAEHFSKHGHKYDLVIEPDGRYRLILQRINTAKPGWGYKEDLGFQSYPLSKPGEYRVRATCRGYFPGAPIETNEIAFTLD